jgi:2'-5' RNA ligase
MFLAVWPPESLVARLRSLERPVRPGLRWTTEDQWHVTLRFLGELDAATSDLVSRAVEVSVGEWVAPTVSAGPAPVALSGHVWVLPVEGLSELAGRVEAATAAAVPVAEARRFRGHLTLARSRRPGGFVSLPAPEVGGVWQVRELTLVGSQLAADGAVYTVIRRWPLESTHHA